MYFGTKKTAKTKQPIYSELLNRVRLKPTKPTTFDDLVNFKDGFELFPGKER